jgi:hypothetical protein
MTPSGVYALVQRHAYCVHLIDGLIEVGLEVAVRSKAFLNMASASVFRMQLHRLEVCNVVCTVKERSSGQTQQNHLVAAGNGLRKGTANEPALKNI